MSTKRQRVSLLAFLLGGMSLISGCGGENENLYEVTGTVTLDGQPLDEAFIVFNPTSGGTTSYGKTDEEGHYRMMFGNDEPGAWQGENLVRISTGDVPTLDSPGKPERVPDVYHERTKLKVNVKPRANTFDFDLRSDAGKVVQPRSGLASEEEISDQATP